jgi:hypothetical protein
VFARLARGVASMRQSAANGRTGLRLSIKCVMVGRGHSVPIIGRGRPWPGYQGPTHRKYGHEQQGSPAQVLQQTRRAIGHFPSYTNNVRQTRQPRQGSPCNLPRDHSRSAKQTLKPGCEPWVFRFQLMSMLSHDSPHESASASRQAATTTLRHGSFGGNLRKQEPNPPTSSFRPAQGYEGAAYDEPR